MSMQMEDIKGYENFIQIEPIHQGLSGDKKYRVQTSQHQTFLLRVSDSEQYEQKLKIFELMKCVEKLEVPMCIPIDFGFCNNGKSIYQLLSWCDGESLESLLPQLTVEQQYALGLKSGAILKKIHAIPPPDTYADWAERYHNTNDERVESFHTCGIAIDGSDMLYRYYKENAQLLCDRPQCFHHGDYHAGNLMLSNHHDLYVIDWEPLDYDNYGDPWEEFNRIGCSEVCPAYTTGLIHGYFDGEPPMEFWKLLAFYLSAGAMMLISWAYYAQRDELQYSIQNAKNILKYFNNMQYPIPTWYLASFV